MSARVVAVILLLGVYLLTLASFDPADIAVGVVIAVLLELGWRRRIARGGSIGTEASDEQRPPLLQSLLGLPALVFAVVVEITRGTWQVAQYSLGLRDPDKHGFIELELEGISEEGVAAWAFMTTISPGEIVADIDEQRGVLIVHTLDASDPEASRRRHHEFYERYQRKVIP
jgi:multicomponent Na+:H+ antiporter subunit E